MENRDEKLRQPPPPPLLRAPAPSDDPPRFLRALQLGLLMQMLFNVGVFAGIVGPVLLGGRGEDFTMACMCGGWLWGLAGLFSALLLFELNRPYLQLVSLARGIAYTIYGLQILQHGLGLLGFLLFGGISMGGFLAPWFLIPAGGVLVGTLTLVTLRLFVRANPALCPLGALQSPRKPPPPPPEPEDFETSGDWDEASERKRNDE